jgi:ABC-type glycerol-3-phosphate transport system permease component
VVTDGNFLLYFRNSVIVAGGSTLLALTVSIFCGYALSRRLLAELANVSAPKRSPLAVGNGMRPSSHH